MGLFHDWDFKCNMPSLGELILYEEAEKEGAGRQLHHPALEREGHRRLASPPPQGPVRQGRSQSQGATSMQKQGTRSGWHRELGHPKVLRDEIRLCWGLMVESLPGAKRDFLLETSSRLIFKLKIPMRASRCFPLLTPSACVSHLCGASPEMSFVSCGRQSMSITRRTDNPVLYWLISIWALTCIISFKFFYFLFYFWKLSNQWKSWE